MDIEKENTNKQIKFVIKAALHYYLDLKTKASEFQFIIYFYIARQSMFPFGYPNLQTLQLLLWAYQQQPQMAYFPSMGINPQTFSPNILSQNIKFGFSSENAKLTPNTPETTEKIQEKSIIIEQDKKSEIVEESNKRQQKVQEKKNLSKQIKKPKRPPTYLTEKAFYMKQKIKGKAKEEKRILRNRVSMNGKDKLRSAKKKYDNKRKEERKRIVLAKTEKIQKKQLEKIIKRVHRENHSSFAVLPNKISGLQELNQFCRKKMEKLMERKVTSL